MPGGDKKNLNYFKTFEMGTVLFILIDTYLDISDMQENWSISLL
jgi:hypothetical protein